MELADSESGAGSRVGRPRIGILPGAMAPAERAAVPAHSAGGPSRFAASRFDSREWSWRIRKAAQDRELDGLASESYLARWRRPREQPCRLIAQADSRVLQQVGSTLANGVGGFGKRRRIASWTASHRNPTWRDGAGRESSRAGS